MKECNWPWATLDDVATVTAGNPAPQGAEFFEGGTRRFVRVRDLGRLNGASHLLETANRVNDRAAATLKLFPKGSVLFTKSGASLLLNQRAILGRDMHVVSHIGVAVPSPRITSEWLYYWLRTVDFADIAHGANMPSLPLARVKQLPVPLPPVSEQQLLVAEIEKQFSRLDEAVANLNRAKAKLGQYESALLEAAVGGRLIAASKANWSKVTVEDVGDVLLGRRRAPEYVTSAHERKYLRVANIKDDRIDFSDLESMRFDDEHLSRYELVPGDVLVSEGQSPEKLGQSAIFSGHPEPLCFQSTLHRFRARRTVTSPEFAQIVFRSHVRSGVFRKLGSITTNIGHLTLEKFKAAPFPLPPLDEQHCIAAEVDRRVSIIREVETEVDANLRRALVLRHAVLSGVFASSGKAVPSQI